MRTAEGTGVIPISDLNQSEAIQAHTVAVYSRPGDDAKTTMVVEVADAHRNLLARSVIETDATREVAADFVLADSAVERCGQWRIDPVHRRRRLVSMVTLRSSDLVSDFERQREAAFMTPRTA